MGFPMRRCVCTRFAWIADKNVSKMTITGRIHSNKSPHKPYNNSLNLFSLPFQVAQCATSAGILIIRSVCNCYNDRSNACDTVRWNGRWSRAAEGRLSYPSSKADAPQRGVRPRSSIIVAVAMQRSEKIRYALIKPWSLNLFNYSLSVSVTG